MCVLFGIFNFVATWRFQGLLVRPHVVEIRSLTHRWMRQDQCFPAHFNSAPYDTPWACKKLFSENGSKMWVRIVLQKCRKLSDDQRYFCLRFESSVRLTMQGGIVFDERWSPIIEERSHRNGDHRKRKRGIEFENQSDSVTIVRNRRARSVFYLRSLHTNCILPPTPTDYISPPTPTAFHLQNRKLQSCVLVWFLENFSSGGCVCRWKWSWVCCWMVLAVVGMELGMFICCWSWSWRWCWVCCWKCSLLVLELLLGLLLELGLFWSWCWVCGWNFCCICGWM